MSANPCEDLFRAVMKGDLSTAKEIIDTYGLSYAKEWSNGYALLCHALRCRQHEMVRLLLNEGAIVNCEDRKPSDCEEKNADPPVKKIMMPSPTFLQKTRKPVEDTVDPMTTWRRARQQYEYYQALDEKAEDELWSRIVGISGYTPLHFAVVKRNEPLVKLLVSKGADVNVPASRGMTPLTIALNTRQQAIANLLLDNGAEVDPYFKHNDPDFQKAAARSNLSVIKRFLIFRSSGKDRHIRKHLTIEIKGDTVELFKKFAVAAFSHDFRIRSKGIKQPRLLYAAVELGFVKIVEALLKQGANPNKLHSSRQGMTVLHKAVFYQHYEITKLLVSHGVNVNVEDKTGKTALTYAIENKNLEIVTVLLSSESPVVTTEHLYLAVETERPQIVKVLLQHAQNVNVNATNQYGGTPLHYAANNSELFNHQRHMINKESNNARGKIAQLLLDYGADVDAKANDGTTALHGAAMCNYVKVVRVLLEKKATVNCFTSRFYMTPIHHAAQKGCYRVVKMLLDHGADIHSTASDGVTPLHLASAGGHPRTVKILAARGADLNIKKVGGITPLHMASERGYSDVVTTLLEFGADIEAEDHNRRTPLHLAAESNKPEVVKILLDRNANLNAITRSYETPLTYALTCNIDRGRNGRWYDEEPINWRDPTENDVNGRAGEYDGSNKVAELVTQHLILLMAIGLPVIQDNIDDLNLYEDSYLLVTSSAELRKLERTKIGDSNVKFVEILTGDLNQVANYSKNKRFVDIMRSRELHYEFPRYAGRMVQRFRLGQKRVTLLGPSLSALAHLSGKVIPEFPALEVFNYLSNADLKNLITASSKVE